MRCARWQRKRYICRERERERRKGRHLSRTEIGDEFCTFPCQNVHLSICTFPCQKFPPFYRTPLLNGAEFTLSVAKYVALFETVRVLCRFCQMAWQGIEAPKQTIENLAAPSFFSSKKWIKLIAKTIGNRRRDCAWGCARGINTTWENLQIEKHKLGRHSFRSPDWFVLFDVQIFSGGVYPPSATSRTISFSISNSFGINISLRSAPTALLTFWLKLVRIFFKTFTGIFALE